MDTTAVMVVFSGILDIDSAPVPPFGRARA